MNEKKVYVINNTTDTNYKLCKVLNEYSNIEDAKKALTELLTNKTTEKKLLKEYGKK